MESTEGLKATSQLQVVITGKDGVTKIVDINEATKILANSKDNFQLKKFLNGKEVLVDNFVVLQDGKTLVIKFTTGEALAIESFYNYKTVEMTFESSNNSIYTLSSNSGLGTALSDGTSLVYAQGNQQLLLSMVRNNESLHTALNDQITTINTEHFAASEGAAAGTVAGMSATTSTLVALGVVAVGAAAAGGGGGGGGGSSSSSSGSSGQLVLSPTEGIDYYKLDGDTEVYVGRTGTDGSFTYSAGQTIIFKVGSTELGRIEMTDSSDGIVTAQDMSGVFRFDTDDEDSRDITDFMYKIDSDGDPSNGFQILRNSNGDIVDDEGNILLLNGVDLDIHDDTEFEAVLGARTDDATLTAHMEESLETYIYDEITEVATTGELDTAIADGTITQIKITASMDISDKDLSVFTDGIIVSDSDSDNSITVNISEDQASNITFDIGSDDEIIADSLEGTVAAVLNSEYLGNGTDVTVTDAISSAQIATINGLIGGGTLTTSIIQDDATNIAAELDNDQDVIITDTDYNVAELKAINDATTGDITLSDPSVALSGTVANLVDAFDGTITEHTGDVTITDGGYTVETLNTINMATTGNITLGEDDIALNGAISDIVSAVDDTDYDGNITVSAAEDYTVAQLKALNDQTTGTITLDNTFVDLSGTAADLVDAFDGTITDIERDVTVTDSASITQLGAIDDNVDGSYNVIYTSITDEIDNITLDIGTTDYVTTNKDVTITDEVTISQLNTVTGAIGIDATLTYSTILDALENIIVAGEVSSYVVSGISVIIDGTITEEDKDLIEAQGATVSTTDIDTATIAEILENDYLGSNSDVTITDETLEASVLAELLEIVTDGTVDATSLTSITGTAAEVAEVVSSMIVTYAPDFTVTLSGIEASAADLNTIDDATTGLITATTIETITSSAMSDVADMIDAIGDTGDKINLDSDWNITLSDTSVSVSDINDVRAATTSGEITATITEGDAATLTGLEVSASNLYTITVTDTSVTAAELNTIDSTTALNVDASAVETIESSDASDITTLITNRVTAGIDSDWDVTVADSPASVSDVNTISAGTDGVVTASLEGTAADLAELTETGNAYTVSVTDAEDADVNASDLHAIGTATTEDVTVENSVNITGEPLDLIKALVLEDSMVVLDETDTTVTVTGTGVTVNNLNAFSSYDGDTANIGVVTATIDASAEDLAGLTDTGNAYTITVNDAAAADVAATDLVDARAATTETVTVTNAVNITGDVDEITAAVITAETKAILADANTTATISGDTTTVAEANAIAAVTGPVTAELAPDSVSNLTALTGTDNAYTITINDAGATDIDATDLAVIGAASTATVTVANAINIQGTVSEITDALVTADSKVVATIATVEITDAGATEIDASDLAAIGAMTSGTVTVNNAIVINGSADEVTAALVTFDSKVEVTDVVVNITDTAGSTVSASDLSAIGGSTTGTVTVENAITITGGYPEITAALFTTDTKVMAVGATVNLTDIDTYEYAADELIGIRAAVTETGTVTVANAVNITGTADDVIDAVDTEATKVTLLDSETTVELSDLSVTIAQANTIASAANIGVITATIETESAANLATLVGTGHAYTIETSGTDASAEDLNTIDAATTLDVDASSITTITSSDVADVKTLISNAATAGINDDIDITLADTDILASDINIVDTYTSGIVTATAATTITGSIAQINTMDEGTTVYNASVNVTLTDTEALASSINTLDGKVATIDASSVEDLTGAQSDIDTLIAADTVIGATTDIEITEGEIAADYVLTLDASYGSIDVTDAATITGTAADVVSLGDASSTIAAADDYDVTISGDINLTQFDAIDADTTGEINVGTIALEDTDDTNVDLADLANATGVNDLDVSNSAANDIANISTDDVLNMTGGTSLIIAGDANDTVDLTGWTDDGFGFYSQGAYEIIVTGDIDVNGATVAP